MKKLLNILTISTLTASVPAPLLANTVQTSAKRDFGSLTSNSNNDYLPIKEIVVLDKTVNSIVVGIKNNLYFGTDDGAFVLKHGATTPTKIIDNGSVNLIAVDKYNNNIYFKKDNGIYFLQTALSWTKQQSQFALVDSPNTQTWTRFDLLSVDGELNIDIANPNIDKVFFDNVEQPQTNKHWTINVKPEIAPRDHNLQVTFTLDGKQYTSEIIVSMQAKIDPPTPSKQENLSDVIKIGDENNLGNIVDSNDNTIFSAITQKNARTVDFSQIVIEKKDYNKATLTTKKESKSYKGSVDVTYNVVPTTVVDLKIDVKPSAPDAIVVKDYLGQLDDSNIINPVNTFYYASSESTITMAKPTVSSVITGVVYGYNNWNKTSQTSNIDPTSGIKLDGSQLATNDGKYVVELSDNLGHTNNFYLQIAPKQTIWNYFDTDNGKLISKEPLTKEQVVAQLKTQIPSDIKIDKVNISNYDVNKVSFELNQSEFKPNDKVNITVKYNNASADSFTLQIKDSKTSDNKKDGLSGLDIVGIVLGSLAGLVIGWLFWKFVINPFILKPIRDKKQKARRIREDKALSEIQTEEEAEKEKKR